MAGEGVEGRRERIDCNTRTENEYFWLPSSNGGGITGKIVWKAHSSHKGG